ncbi:hypothetical protein SLNHY_0836 [Streptomyces albus]|nr:hypothetical protein SLNHY_0836 [Streptomyces albus]
MEPRGGRVRAEVPPRRGRRSIRAACGARGRRGGGSAHDPAAGMY